MKFYSLLLSVAFLLIAPGHPLHSQPSDQIVAGVSLQKLKHYEKFLNEQIEEGHIPGAVSLILRDGKVIHKKAFGYQDLENKTSLKEDALFFIQSMTKPIISVAFMMLYEEGHFLLTDPVAKYLPEFKDLMVCKDVEVGKDGEKEALKQPITIAHLLSHTAGLSHGLGTSTLDRQTAMQLWLPHPDVATRVNHLVKMPLIGQPGEQWYYSAAPDVLSVLIEQFSGMSTNDFLQEKIFDPLEMKDTGYNIPKANQSRVVKVYQKDEEGKIVETPNQPKMEGNTLWSGVNALFSTASDYAKFCEMLLNGGERNGKRILSRKTIELMTKNHVGDLFDIPAASINIPGHGFGLGFAVTTDLANSQIPGSEGTFFWAGAFNTHFFIDPQEKIIGVFMTQMNPFSYYHHNKMKQFVYQAIVD